MATEICHFLTFILTGISQSPASIDTNLLYQYGVVTAGAGDAVTVSDTATGRLGAADGRGAPLGTGPLHQELDFCSSQGYQK